MTLLSPEHIADALGIHRPTPEQARIIAHPPGPMLVVAGAGSGKTETMAARVVWLVANRFVAPERVLGLTFTRKAAAELGARVAARLSGLRAAGIWTPGDDPGSALATPTVSTYHAYAARLVREHALRVGREPEVRLLSESAAWQIASEAVAAYDGPLEQTGRAESTITNAVVDLAGEMAEHLVTADELGTWLDAFEARMVQIESAGRPLLSESAAMRADLRARRLLVPVLAAYDRLKRQRGAMDFADQMSVAADLAQRFPVVGAIERERYGAVLLDEFQDTSHAQLMLLTALFGCGSGGGGGAEGRAADFDAGEGTAGVRTGTGHAVTAVGDPNQSIYAWRGASAATLAAFPAAFGAGAEDVLPLSQTWRNDRRILTVANAVAAPLRAATTIPVAPLVAAPRAADGLIDVARPETIEDEARMVVAWIEAQRRGGATSAAILCRKRSQFAPLIHALETAQMPYEVVGLGGLLMTPEVQDVVALISVAHDAARGDRLMRLLTGPVVRLGAADLDRFHAWARRTQTPADRRGPGSRGSDLSGTSGDRISLVEALVELDRADPAARAATGIGAVALGRLRDLAAALAHIRRHSWLGLAELVDEAERALSLDVEVLSRPQFGPAAARAHLDAFADVAAGFAMSSDRPTIGGFLAWLDAAVEEERGLDRGTIEVAPGAVHVLTVHAAKGLEWDAVAVPGMVEGTFPVHSATSSRFDAGTGGWRVGIPGDSAWARGLGGLPYDLRGDRDALPGFDWRSAATAKQLDERRAAFRESGGRRGIEEERRLAYVALTRARHRLLVTAPVWGTQATPRVVSRFLTEILDAAGAAIPGDPEAGASNPRHAQPLRGLWPVIPDAAPAVAEAADRVLAELAELPGGAQAAGAEDPALRQLDPAIAVLLAERLARQVGPGPALDMAQHRSVADLVALAADPETFRLQRRRPMPAPPSPGTRRGTAFHSWIERHYRRAALLEPDDLPGSADADEDDGRDLAAMIARFEESPWADREPLEVEVAVETVIAGVAVRGRIDAVFPEGEGVVLVDWKSGSPPRGVDARTRSVQLAVYRLAYARLRGLALEQVDTAFYYAGTGQTVRPEPVTADELERLVRIDA
jgi:DNA helicase-2/ATP-dependent DNA helicase PcrA